MTDGDPALAQEIGRSSFHFRSAGTEVGPSGGWKQPGTAASHRVWTSGIESGMVPCSSDEGVEPISLSILWDAMRRREPGYRGAAGQVDAGHALRSAVRRERIPGFSVDGLANYGQRLSPSEERVLGVGPRGEFRIFGSWTLLDSDRWWREAEAERRLSEAQAGQDVFDQTYRTDLAVLYLEASLAESVWEVRRDHVAALLELSVPVRARLEAGVDVTWEEHLLDEAVARSERLFAEAEQARAGFRAELSALVGRCVRPIPLTPVAEVRRMDQVATRSPAVRHLLRQAETREALAGAEANRGRWQLQLLATTGPNYSRAYRDGRVMNESLVGFGVSWRPDLSGSRRYLAAAEEAQAAALRAEAESLELALQQTLDRIAAEMAHAGARRDALEQELEQARRREQAALLRWIEGVDRWAEVLQARDRVQQVRLLQVQWVREVGHAHVRWGEGTGEVEDLPLRLGAATIE